MRNLLIALLALLHAKQTFSQGDEKLIIFKEKIIGKWEQACSNIEGGMCDTLRKPYREEYRFSRRDSFIHKYVHPPYSHTKVNISDTIGVKGGIWKIYKLKGKNVLELNNMNWMYGTGGYPSVKPKGPLIYVIESLTDDELVISAKERKRKRFYLHYKRIEKVSSKP